MLLKQAKLCKFTRCCLQAPKRQVIIICYCNGHSLFSSLLYQFFLRDPFLLSTARPILCIFLGTFTYLHPSYCHRICHYLPRIITNINAIHDFTLYQYSVPLVLLEYLILKFRQGLFVHRIACFLNNSTWFVRYDILCQMAINKHC